MEYAGRREAVVLASIRNEPDMPRWQMSTGPALEMHGQIFGPPAERRDALGR